MSHVNSNELIISYYEMSQINYASAYATLYASYNAWHRKIINAPNDREAIRTLKKDIYLWEEYYEGACMAELACYFEMVVKFTRKGWPVRVVDAEDWRGLIDFWYKIRCELVHGQLDPKSEHHITAVYLAYKTLHVYMKEVVNRIKLSFADADSERLEELNLIESLRGLSAKQKSERTRLYDKFLSV